MRRFLDRTYETGLWLSAACIALIAALVLLQVGGRLLDRLLLAVDLPRTGFAVPSLAEIGAFLFVASSFLALACTFRAGAHIRVTLFSKLMGPRLARMADLFSLALASAIALFAAWHSWVQALDSYTFGSVSFGVIKIPLALPQGAMSLGITLLAIALLDELVGVWRTGSLSFESADKTAETGAQAPQTAGH
ncbi:MAG: TRAP transporter small permease [Pseudomonadota bacterium]